VRVAAGLLAVIRNFRTTEQCRLAQLLIERVVIADGGLEIIWRDHGWQELAGELLPGTIGAELQEWDQQEVYEAKDPALGRSGRPRKTRWQPKSSCPPSSR
jgi:hypothetical protein